MFGIRSLLPLPRRSRVSSPKRSSALATVLALGFLAASCTEPEPEPTTAEILAELEGRELSAAEVAEREQVAQLLCRLDDAVLVQIWDRLSAQQLEFQDFVFGRACDNRSALYAEQTGRLSVTEE